MTQVSDAIRTMKEKLGKRLCIAGHHYQHDEVIRHCDITGDSLELARRLIDVEAEHIIFCGVHFMAESAALLARPNQKVHMPTSKASCVMAQMTPAALVRAVLKRLNATGRKVLPLAYVNTPLAVKAVVGEFDGATCTSSNAAKMLRWALDNSDSVLFLPDANLGRNTARGFGMTEQDWHTLDIRRGGSIFAPDLAGTKRLLLWPGCCGIHAKMRLEHVLEVRRAHPEATIVVHPECSPEVVLASDLVGSTSYIINYVKNAPRGSVIGIGTEFNLVNRLAQDFAENCTVVPIRNVQCSHMAKTTEELLLNVLHQVEEGTAPQIVLVESQKAPARASLERMLEVC